MNFTREPIILSVITPKEGSKLVVRSSKGSEEEDYFVDAIEVVSFEGAVFFRSTERPKSFLVPASDYEILELKETKIVLKNVSVDKTIKISSQGRKEERDKKNRRLRRRRPLEEERQEIEEGEVLVPPPLPSEVQPSAEETHATVLRKMIPPPNTLIKEKLARFKNEEFFEKNLLPSPETLPEAQPSEAPVELLNTEPKVDELKAEEEPPQAKEEKGLDS